MSEKLKINMLSQATSVDGQGVGSAYLEQVALVKECDDIFETAINSKSGKFDIYHMHTFNPSYVMRLNRRHLNVAYVHCIPTTFDGSLKMPRFAFWVFKKFVVHAYRKADSLANRGECTLTEEWVVNHIFNSKCVYCGESDWKKLGCDRIDNSQPHTPSNVVCCCGKCNREKHLTDADVFKKIKNEVA